MVEIMLTTMFDIKYYKKYLDTCYLHANFGSFCNPIPLFLLGFHNFHVVKFFLDNDMKPLLSVCFHIQCMSFNLEQQQLASYCYLFRK